MKVNIVSPSTSVQPASPSKAQAGGAGKAGGAPPAGGKPPGKAGGGEKAEGSSSSSSDSTKYQKMSDAELQAAAAKGDTKAVAEIARRKAAKAQEKATQPKESPDKGNNVDVYV